MTRLFALFFLLISHCNLLYAGEIPMPINESIGNPIKFEITPTQKKGQYSSTHPVVYQLLVSNKSKIDEVGILKYEVLYKGKEILVQSFDVNITAGNSLKSKIVIPVEYDGSYEVNFHLELLNFNGTIKETFSFNGDQGNIESALVNGKISNSKNALNGNNKTPEKAPSIYGDQSKNAPVNIEYEEEEGEIISTVTPAVKDGTFNQGDKIVYNINLKSTYSIPQIGNMNCQILNIKNEVIYEQSKVIKLGRFDEDFYTIKLKSPESGGMYRMRLCLNLSAYDDTTLYSFGYDLVNLKTPYHKPPDFDVFWANTMAELAKVDPEYKVSISDEYTNDDYMVYRVDMMSYQNIPIYGWLSVPRTKGRFPVIVGYGAYLRTIYPEFFNNYACFMLNARGADPTMMHLINPEKRELFVVGIESKETYVYRGMYMDCIRAMDFVTSHAAEFNFDLDRVGVYGGSQGGTLSLVTAALLKRRINTVSADSPVYCDLYSTLEIIADESNPCYILRDIQNLPQTDPAFSRENILNTLSYFEVQNFMPSITCSVLIGTGLMDMIAPPSTVIGAFNKLTPKVRAQSEIYTYPSLTHEVPEKHYTIRGYWMNEKLTEKRHKNNY